MENEDKEIKVSEPESTPVEENSNTPKNIGIIDEKGEAIEKKCFSKYSQRRINRLRTKGWERGLDVPYLQHELTGDRKSTLALKIMIILTAILIAGAVALTIFGAFMILVPFASAASETSDTLHTVNQIPILNLLTGSLTGILWIIAIAIPLLAASLVITCISFLFSLIRIRFARAEEKAVGFGLKSIKTASILFGVVFIVAAVTLFVLTKVVLPSIVCLLISAYCIALFAILQKEQNTAKEWFSTLPQEQQDSAKNFFKKLDAINLLIKQEKKSQRATYGTSKNSKLFLIISIIARFLDIRFLYSNIKKNPKLRERSITLGLMGIKESFMFGAVALISVLLFHYGVSSVGTNIFAIVIIIFAIAFLLYTAVIELPIMLNLTIKQLIINKKWSGWVSLVLNITVIVAAILICALIFAA